MGFLSHHICSVPNKYLEPPQPHSMESVAGLRFSPLPNIPSLRIPSCFHSARATKPQLSLSHSFLSLPRTFEGRLLHRPVSCKPYGSRHRGAENVPLTAFFPWILGRIHCWKPKAGETGMGVPPNQPGDGEGHQIQQIMKVAEELQSVGNVDMAVQILKAYAPLAAAHRDEHNLQLVEQELMKCLHAQGNYGEAFQYWLQLYNKKSPYLKTISKKLQRDLFENELTELSEGLSEKPPDETTDFKA